MPTSTPGSETSSRPSIPWGIFRPRSSSLADSRARRYLRGMRRLADWLPSPVVTARIVLVAFVLTWLFGPYVLRATVPIWVAFVIAAGLELHFFVEAVTRAPVRRPDRGPQDVDRERYGYEREPQELLLLREGSDELWIPYAGET